MILKDEQINRYLRHIKIPEINTSGQNKLLATKAILYLENVNEAYSLINYLAATGIGHIFCCFEDASKYEALFNNIKDLNNDISIKLINKNSLLENKECFYENNSRELIRIFFGNINYIKSLSNLIDLEDDNEFVPTIMALKGDWNGTLQTFYNFNELIAFIKFLKTQSSSLALDSYGFASQNPTGHIISASLLGAICSLELIKICLKLGELSSSLMYFDIFNMEFYKSEKNEEHLYIDKLLSNNYSDYIHIKEKLSECKVLIVGTGGLGSPAALALAIAGIGTIGLVDYDKVEISNLNRQLLHSTSRIGIPKVESAKTLLKRLNSNLEIATYNMELNKETVVEIISNYNIIIDAVDNLPTRYLLNDACYFMKKPMVEAGVLRFSGLNTTIIPEDGHCFRCAFPNTSKLASAPSSAELGVLGPVPGVMGFIQAAEAIKLAIGKGNTLKNKILYFDALDLEFTLMELNKNPFCPLCGKQPEITDL